MTNRRLEKVDYLKSVFIVLMVIFHLVYIGDKYPYIKQIVYTFHMPAFLIISGYLANIHKSGKSFFLSMWWIFTPYAIMEIGYVVMSAILPVREKVAELTWYTLLDKIFLTPIGPYWYLHTLIACSVVYYLVNKICPRLPLLPFLIVLGVCLAIISYWFHLFNFANAMYYLIGLAVARAGISFFSLFRASPLSVVPIVILCSDPSNLDRFTLAGVAITYLFMSFFLWIYDYIPNKMRVLSLFIGRNTLPILLFSPVFTIITRAFVPYFWFDTTGICFTLVAVTFVIGGCMGIAWTMDKIKLSKWFCGKEQMRSM